VITPHAAIAAMVPAFLSLAGWFVLAGLVYAFLGFETKGRSFEEIDTELSARA
jgi:MFS transporter, putative metabolite:H+ symporter